MDHVTLYRVKTPGEGKGAWDCYAPVQATAAADAFLPASRDCTP